MLNIVVIVDKNSTLSIKIKILHPYKSRRYLRDLFIKKNINYFKIPIRKIHFNELFSLVFKTQVFNFSTKSYF